MVSCVVYLVLDLMTSRKSVSDASAAYYNINNQEQFIKRKTIADRLCLKALESGKVMCLDQTKIYKAKRHPLQNTQPALHATNTVRL